MSLRTWDRPHFKADEPSRFERRKTRKAEAETTWRKVCGEVDTRDKLRCRVCGKRGDPDSVDLLRKLHRHHLVYRSAGGQDTLENLVSLCAQCHDDEHRHRLKIEGTGARLTISRREAAGGWFVSRQEVDVHVTERD
jgi:5-methylcytosine-specific restriction endonuclease McrA